MMKMKTLYKILSGVAFLSVLASCDYERINTNPFEMTEEEGQRDGAALGSYVTLMERSVIPVGTQANSTDIINKYQVAYNLCVDGWSGYFGQDNNWKSGNNPLTYYLVDDWGSTTYSTVYTDVLPSWKKLREKSEEGMPEVYALAQILKISTWHKALETYGPIPYTHAGEMALVIPFDSEKEVYTAMFEDLKDAIETLTPLANNGDKIMSDFDVVYKGDVQKWVKYAKSLMLRLAIRLKYADPVMSRQWATEAYGGSIMNLISTIDEEAKMGGEFVNNIQYLADNYGECSMGSSMFAYLSGYKDPRLEKYFRTSEVSWALEAFDGKKYAPLPPGTASPAKTFAGRSVPNFASNTPTYWMRASEICFLLAEAALEWSEFGNAEDWYKQGIQMSFSENGVSSSVDSYLNDVNVPVSVTINVSNVRYSASAPTAATTEFDASNKEKALEKIMIQKWIAMFPNGMEAWTEWRRTGYPKLNPVHINNGAAQQITKESGIRRMIYPSSFSQSDKDSENLKDALQKLGGEDKATTKLWWDCKK